MHASTLLTQTIFAFGVQSFVRGTSVCPEGCRVPGTEKPSDNRRLVRRLLRACWRNSGDRPEISEHPCGKFNNGGPHQQRRDGGDYYAS